jgi:hypothetical protein
MAAKKKKSKVKPMKKIAGTQEKMAKKRNTKAMKKIAGTQAKMARKPKKKY